MAGTKGSKEGGDGLEKLIERLMAETEGVIPRGFAEQVEQDLTGAGRYAVSRRVALAFLETPWRESAEKVKADRKVAVAIAHAAEVLEAHSENYEHLLEWLRAAQTRMRLALSVREDMQDVMAEGKRGDLKSLQLIVDNSKKS